MGSQQSSGRADSPSPSASGRTGSSRQRFRDSFVNKTDKFASALSRTKNSNDSRSPNSNSGSNSQSASLVAEAEGYAGPSDGGAEAGNPIDVEKSPPENTNRLSQSARQSTKSSMPVTVPCQYRTGKTLGSGTYAIVKEAIHIKTGKYYACKVINKKLMEGREHMVRNEIAVLKRISSGHRNIVTLHDYFETSHNLYLCFDLCTGGELFDRICAKGNYYEADAAGLVRTIFKAVKYIHDCGIVHRDLKPENLLFRTEKEDADIMIADFGLSRIMEEEKLNLLTEICGTPGYMAPEIFKKTGHHKPVDIWAMGVITYFLLAGYTPFDRDSQTEEMRAIMAGDYSFTPAEYWANVSDTAKDFVRCCLEVDDKKRMTAEQALQHVWLADEKPHFVPDPKEEGGMKDLLPHVKKAFNAKKLWRKAAFSITAMNRMAALAGGTGEFAELKQNIQQYKDESEKEVMEEASITHHHNLQHPSVGSPTSPVDPSKRAADNVAADELAKKVAGTSLG